MHRLPLLLIALTLLSCTHARPAVDPLEDFARRTDETRAALRIPGLSMAVVRDGKLVMARGLGTSDAETIYPIGSITKTFTATLMLQLAEEGRLDLDHDVARYVDWEVPADVRIRHVLSHTSEGTPGTRFAYSSRFNWLDNVVEAATKENFRELMIARVLKPALLTNTLPGEEREGYAESIAGLAAPHRVEKDGTVVRSKYPPMALHSSSGLSSTVTDLARYSIALDEGRLLSAAARERAFVPANAPGGAPFPYGAGWFSQMVGRERVVWHTSWWPDAYSGLLVKVPAKKLTLVLLANTDTLVSPQNGTANVLLYPIANDFLRTFLGGEHRGMSLIANALTQRARGERAMSDALLRQAIDCCLSELATVSDDDRMRLFAESDEPVVRKLAAEAGQRLTAAYPDDLGIAFNLGMIYGRVRPSLAINGADGESALTVFKRIADSSQSRPKWMEAWSNYLVAEHIAGRDPARAKIYAERAMATGVDTDGLRGRVEALIARLVGFSAQ